MRLKLREILRSKTILERNSNSDRFKVKDDQTNETTMMSDKDIINDIKTNDVEYFTEKGARVRPYGEDDITTKPNNSKLDNIGKLPINENLQ